MMDGSYFDNITFLYPHPPSPEKRKKPKTGICGGFAPAYTCFREEGAKMSY
jgi:hypothetical protein